MDNLWDRVITTLVINEFLRDALAIFAANRIGVALPATILYLFAPDQLFDLTESAHKDGEFTTILI